MAFDNVCKTLAESYPANFACWLLGDEYADRSDIQVLKTELSLEPIRADAVTFLQTGDRILHLEFQTIPESKPPLPFRILDYWVRLHRQYGCAITQIVLFLKPIDSEAVRVEQFEAENTLHRYRVVRMWEQDPTPLTGRSKFVAACRSRSNRFSPNVVRTSCNPGRSNYSFPSATHDFCLRPTAGRAKI